MNRQRVTGRQHHIHQARTEAEASNPLHGCCDEHGDTGQHGVDHVQYRGNEHEGEFQRLGDTGEEGRECARHHDTQHFCFVLWTRAVVDSQRSTRQTEHHNREEARLVTTGDTNNRFTCFDGLCAAEEVRDIVNTCNVKPEHGVQRVVQTNRDQQTVEERIDARTNGTQLLDMLTEVYQTVEDHRPDVHQDESDNDHDEGGQDRHQTTAAEEGECFWQLNATEAVVQFSGDDTHHNTHELVADLAERCRNLVRRDLLNHGNRSRGAERGQHKEAHEAGQCRSTVFIFGHTISHTNGKQYGHVINNGRTGLNEERR